MASNDIRFYTKKASDTCAAVTKKNGIDLANFYDWNTGLDHQCRSVWQDTYYSINRPSP